MLPDWAVSSDGWIELKMCFRRRVWTGTPKPSNLKLVKAKRESQTGDTAKAATASDRAAWRTTASATRFAGAVLTLLSLSRRTETALVYIHTCRVCSRRRRRSCARPFVSASAVKTSRRARRGRRWCTWPMQQKWEFSSRRQPRPSCPHRSQTCSCGRRQLFRVEAGGTAALCLWSFLYGVYCYLMKARSKRKRKAAAALHTRTTQNYQ